MKILKFKAKEVRPIVEHALAATEFYKWYGETMDAPRLWLVGDDGVYLMSNGNPPLWDHEREKNAVAYAEGINPTVDDFETWWANKGATFGSSDGCEPLDLCTEVLAQINAGHEFVRLKITPKDVMLVGFAELAA